jgi:predicted protein tyrosine phosphatase
METQHLTHAIAAHAKWKYRLRRAIDSGESEWTVDQVRADDACDFGRWLGSLSPVMRTSRNAKAVIACHAEFHRTAAHVLELALARRRDEAETAIAAGSPFAETSKRLTLAVMAWQKDVAPAPPG